MTAALAGHDQALAQALAGGSVHVSTGFYKT